MSSARLGASLLALLCLLSCGCALGPRALLVSRQKYNEAVLRTDREELLLNIVRSRYEDSIGVLPIGAIATQHAWDYSAGASGDVGGDALDVLNLTGRAAFSERPTVSYAMPSQDVAKAFLNPITPESIFVLTYTGSPTEHVMNLIVKSINGVDNAISAGGPIPEHPPEFEEFRWLVQNLAVLRANKQIEIGRLPRLIPVSDPVSRDTLTEEDFRSAFEADYSYEPTGDGNLVVLHKKETATFLRFSNEALLSPEYAEIVRMLHLKPGLQQYELKLALEGQLLDQSTPQEGRDEILVSIRSVLEVINYLAKGVDVPAKHIDKGLAAVTRDAQGCPFDWQQVLDNRFQIRVSKWHPSHPAVAVKYRNHWFYIDDRDHASKTTLMLIRKIYALEATAGGVQSLPTLTLPVGG